MSLYLGGASGAANIAVPFPAPVLGVMCNYAEAVNEYVLPLPTNDGSSVTLSNSFTLSINNKSNAALWTLTPTGVNASATIICGLFLDTTNQVVWVLANNASAGHGYLAAINYTTGVVSKIGTGFTSPSNTLVASTQLVQIERASIGSGDLTIWNGTYNFSVSTTTGAVTVAESQLLLNSIGINSSTESFWYSTADKTLFALIAPIVGASSQSSLTIFRNGQQRTCVFDASAVGGLVGTNGAVVATQWGANQVWVTAFYNGSTSYGTAMFNRPSFDAWLQRIASSMGMA